MENTETSHTLPIFPNQANHICRQTVDKQKSFSDLGIKKNKK
jgi:hypothetical protein